MDNPDVLLMASIAVYSPWGRDLPDCVSAAIWENQARSCVTQIQDFKSLT